MKKLIATIMAAILVLSCFAGCGAAPAEDNQATPTTGGDSVTESVPDEVIIGVAINKYGPLALSVKDYFENYLGPNLNVKFVFSEEVGSVETILSFVENAYSAGAVGIIECATSSPADVQPIAAKCDELGMYFATYYPGSAVENGTFSGIVDSDNSVLAQEYSEMIKASLSDGEAHSMVLCTVAARYGNVQQFNSSVGAFKAFVETYDLDISEEKMYEYIMSDAIAPVETGRDDVKIVINPLFTGEDLTEALKTGDYDTVVITGDIYLMLQNAIAEAEKAFNKDIRVYVTTGVSPETGNCFNTSDPFGNATLNGASMKSPANYTIMLAVVLNAVYGDIDAVKAADGTSVNYKIKNWRAESPEEYAIIDKIGGDESSYIFTQDEFKQMIKHYNPEVTAEWLQNYIDENCTVDSVVSRRGIQ